MYDSGAVRSPAIYRRAGQAGVPDFPNTLSGRFFMPNTRLLPLLAALAFAPFIQAGIGDYPRAATPGAPSGQEWQSEQRLGLNKEKPHATFNSYADVESAKKILPEFSR